MELENSGNRPRGVSNHTRRLCLGLFVCRNSGLSRVAQGPSRTGNQQVVIVPAQCSRKRALLVSGVGCYRFRLKFINLGKHILNRQKLEFGRDKHLRAASTPTNDDALSPELHPDCSLRQMRRAAVRAGSIRIFRGEQRAAPLEMRALRLLL